MPAREPAEGPSCLVLAAIEIGWMDGIALALSASGARMLMKELIAAHADVHRPDDTARTVLMCAAANGQVRVRCHLASERLSVCKCARAHMHNSAKCPLAACRWRCCAYFSTPE